MSTDCITYHIDKNDRIVFLSHEWHSFAGNNRAEVLTSENVLNKSIYDFLADGKVKHLYELLIQRSRNEQVHIRLPFRCDSPDTRRYMAMEVFPLANGFIAFRSCTLREEKREPVLLLDISMHRSNDVLTICSWCKRVKDDENCWCEVEEAIQRMSLFNKNLLPELSHGMCTDCYENALIELKDAN